MRAAPETYDRQDQQDVRNEIERLKKNYSKPSEYILMKDTADGSLHYVRVTSGSLVVTAAST